ncbi:MAG: hydroxyacylglutathione hydrolase [Pseudomonadota bacterium]
MPLEIVTVPCLSDNYAFLMRCTETDQVAAVDVPDATPIEAALKAQGWSLDHILLTHHHGDHVDGVPDLVKATGASVSGAIRDKDRLPPLDTALDDEETFTFGAQTCRVIDVSGHTINHIAFLFEDAKAAFTGDSLMTWGCGRVFEGTHAQMWNSLQKFGSLPGDTTLYTGHEYTASNAKFAQTIEPDNGDYTARAAEVAELRAKDIATVPSNLGVERQTNPFLRADNADLQYAIGLRDADPADVFSEVRTRKDNF